jgi:uncharacterized protein (DUF2252 family)
MSGAPTTHQPSPPTSTADRAAAGRAVRRRVRRSTLGDWTPAPDRDPLGLLDAQEATRVPELVPLRHERMAVSPFTFFRGAATVFAADMADEPRTELDVQLCGDAHLANFGAFASPERVLVFDINDFDETLPGPFEWDVKRLAASFEVAGRSNGFDEQDRQATQFSLASAYASAMAEFAGMHHLDLWYRTLSAEDILERWGDEIDATILRRFAKTVTKAKGKDRLRAMRRLTTMSDGAPRFLSDPPVLQPMSELMGPEEQERMYAQITTAFELYRRSLQTDRRALLERYQLVDLARKVVGVGSVGTRCWVALLVGREDGDPLFLQVKEAERSVLEPHLARSIYHQQGRRVVEGQRFMQAASDIFLGWVRLDGLDGRPHDYYFRQLWDWKASADIDTMSPALLAVYAKLCGYTLARAHARSGDSVAISAYLGGGNGLGQAMVRFSVAYADQNEKDHAAFASRLDGDLRR